MANITYLLGAGASFNACPILNMQAEAMIYLANKDLSHKNELNEDLYFSFTKDEEQKLKNNKELVLWHIGYFGVKAKEFGTIDTYARKLYLNNEARELRLLKMSVSVFFDLWENFYNERYFSFGSKLTSENRGINQFEKIDKRYISLLSIFLQKDNSQVRLNDSVKFITWNYDLQLEAACKMFLKEGLADDFENLNSRFVFKNNDRSKLKNQIFHLNGHRGFYDSENRTDKSVKHSGHEMNKKHDFDNYWVLQKDLFQKTIDRDISFNNFIKYAWEHNLEDNWFQKISNVLNGTEVLIIIGYSFPLFNRIIDQNLLKNLNKNRIKEIVYQDPYANEETVKSLFEDLNFFKGRYSPKLKIESKNLNQFYVPHNYFIS